MIAAKTIINYITTTIILKANNHQYKGISMGVLLHQKERILMYLIIPSKIMKKNKMIFCFINSSIWPDTWLTWRKSNVWKKLLTMTKKLSKKKILYLKKKDIEKMFDSFRESNYKKNPVYQYVWVWKNKKIEIR